MIGDIIQRLKDSTYEHKDEVLALIESLQVETGLIFKVDLNTAEEYVETRPTLPLKFLKFDVLQDIYEYDGLKVGDTFCIDFTGEEYDYRRITGFFYNDRNQISACADNPYRPDMTNHAEVYWYKSWRDGINPDE